MVVEGRVEERIAAEAKAAAEARIAAADYTAAEDKVEGGIAEARTAADIAHRHCWMRASDSSVLSLSSRQIASSTPHIYCSPSDRKSFPHLHSCFQLYKH